MAEQYRISVRNFEGDVIARVRYNQNLDYWDGRNWTCGSTGRHKGLTKLRDGSYVLIHGTQWQGESDSAEIISEQEALQEIMKSGNYELLKLKKFKDLNKIYKEQKIDDQEDEDDEILEEE